MKQLNKVFVLYGLPDARFFIIIFITFSLISLITCAKYADTGGDYPEDYNRVTETWSGNVEGEKYKEESGLLEPEMDFREGKDTDKEKEAAKQEKPEERMKVYFGYLKLRVENVKETRSAISSLADEVGGYVEASYEDTVIIRIPKELFTEILTTLMDMGEVLNKSIVTYDVTDIFQDFTARLEIAKKTRDRLYNLLEKTKDVKERLKILREIRRLSEEIEKISMTLENIKRLIAFSRITIQLEQRLTDLSYEDKRTIPFPWIAVLDPFYITLSQLDGTVTLKTGDEFAVFDKREYFFAESTDGVRIRIAATKNSPEGDADFWQKAVEYHLSRFYKETEFLELGSFKAVQFMSKDADPFYYIVGIMVKGKKIFVCEVLFPDQATFKHHGQAVKGYIKEGEVQ